MRLCLFVCDQIILNLTISLFKWDYFQFIIIFIIIIIQH